MRAFVFGQSGTSHEAVRNAVSLFSEGLSHQRYPRRLEWLSFEEELRTSKGQRSPLPILVGSSNDMELRESWVNGFEKILEKIESFGPETDVVVSMHASYFRDNRFRIPVDLALLSRFEPDICVTLIDDIYDVWYRLSERYSRSKINGYFRLDEIAQWRSVEVELGDLIARAVTRERRTVHNYVFAVKHPVENLFKLLCEGDTWIRAYACCPITRPRTERDPSRRKALMDEVDQYRDTLHEKYIVFDPLTIDEDPVSKAFRQCFPGVNPEDHEIASGSAEVFGEATGAGGSVENRVVLRKDMRWPTSHAGGFQRLAPMVPGCFEQYGIESMSLFPNEVARLCSRRNVNSRSLIADQITQRDFRLIDQSQVMPAWRPWLGNEVPRGQNTELHYAERTGVPSVVYWPAEDGSRSDVPLDPLTHICNSEDEFFATIDEIAQAI